MPKGESEVAEMAERIAMLKSRISHDQGCLFTLFLDERCECNRRDLLAFVDRIIARLTASDEPVAWRVDQTFEDGTPLTTFVHLERDRAERVRDYIARGMMHGTVTPLFTHSAPAASEKGREVTEAMLDRAMQWDQRHWHRTLQDDDAMAQRDDYRSLLTAAFSAPAGGVDK